ncbi:hypothetical protein TPHA_0M00540 [Tetrapisispora phaffii CBS 4417]|uniref:Derlin n=1 Tax=Tetrapisispora phaffii (strain ATCC 24235 / CBS 4417 / NBRC 1672 / NRRL Y-8282 / UCD 70-5) TaxID=1071381 RepID=G8C0B4_TETPH|nr:hypothetical protein TPHA_0M00540 [Tetrapisispora phaffii CBS 4417]CCE65629.1 hypothetical protein TPHA_0M00540 [Tetrapisispora phaffii CBS 4417]
MSTEVPAGFNKYPATQLCFVATIVVPLLANALSYKYLFMVRNDPFIIEYNQYWRFVTFQFGALNESDVVLLALIWYNFRQIERLMGSYKYLSVISLCWMYTTLILSGSAVILNVVFPWSVWQNFPSGSLPLVLTLFHFYKQYTPQIYEFEFVFPLPWQLQPPTDSDITGSQYQSLSGKKTFKWKLTDQFYIEFLIVLLVLSQGFAGIVCGFISWIIGVLLDGGLLPGMKVWRLPLFLFSSDNIQTHNVNDIRNQLQNSTEGTADANENLDDVPPRSLGRQFIDTFRG